MPVSALADVHGWAAQTAREPQAGSAASTSPEQWKGAFARVAGALTN